VDPFAVIMLGGTRGLVIALVLVGRGYRGSSADLLDWKPARSAELEIQNELDDMTQLLEVANRRRRRRGEIEVTEDSVREDVAEQQREQDRRRAEYLEALEVDQMLDVVNARRRRRGQPELTPAEYRAEVERQEHEAGS
jgi:hypothetical protein